MAVVNLFWYALQVFEGFGSEPPHATRLVVLHDQANESSVILYVNDVATQFIQTWATTPVHATPEPQWDRSMYGGRWREGYWYCGVLR